MPDTNWTPGPWRICDMPCDVLAADGLPVASTSYPHTATPRDQRQRMRDARLIAAAPDLYAALRTISDWDTAAAPNEPGGMSILDAIDIARAALAKADGR